METSPQPAAAMQPKHLEMFKVLGEASLQDDLEFAMEVVNGQKLLEPVDLVEAVNSLRKSSSDASEHDAWQALLFQILKSYGGIKFPKEELARLHSIIAELKVKHEADEARANQPVDNIEPVNAWDKDEYFIFINETLLDQLRSIPSVAEAENYAKNEMFEQAKSTITQLSGERAAAAHNIIDFYIHRAAKQMALNSNLRVAHNLIYMYGSCTTERQKMLASLDKILFTHAGKLTDAGLNNEARELINRYASSPTRAATMCGKLGLNV